MRSEEMGPQYYARKGTPQHRLDRDWLKFYGLAGSGLFFVSTCLCCVLISPRPITRPVQPADIIGKYRYQYRAVINEDQQASITFNADGTFLQEFPDARRGQIKEHRGTWKPYGPQLELTNVRELEGGPDGELRDQSWVVMGWLGSADLALFCHARGDPDTGYYLQRDKPSPRPLP